MLLDEPSHDAIRAIRQLTLMFSKINLPCSDYRTRSAMRDYVKCEQEVAMADAQRTLAMKSDFERMSALLFQSAFSKVDLAIYQGLHVPRHGPGATADKFRANEKFNLNTWPDRLEHYFPYGEFALPNWRFFGQMESIRFLDPGSEIPVKVISVPKTLKTPRIIGIEPTAMQYAQQAILPEILEAVTQDSLLNNCLGFSDQTPNQRMAESGSLNGDLATLDLSEASDRVSNQLVRSLMRYHPHLDGAVQACRSTRASVPGQGTHTLSKFASMGSALTFPIEAMVFLTIVALGIERELNIPLGYSQLRQELCNRVRIYGDDIIVPVEYVRSVIDSLEAFGLKVNRHKSFWTGRFRESCGKDFYAGSDVSVVRFRREFPRSRRNAQEVISLVSFRNQMYFAGYWGTCQWLDGEIRKMLKHFPVVLPSSPVLGRHSFLGFETQKTDPYLHRPMVKGYVVSALPPTNRLDGSGALLKYFLKEARANRFGSLDWAQSSAQPSEEKHLERSGRPHAVNIKLRWSPSG
jgi:hypothetical protein